MKIHTTTQDLNLLVQQDQQATNNVSSKGFRLKNYSEQMLMPKLSAESADYYSSSISFKGGKKPTVNEAKKVLKSTKKLIGDIAKESNIKLSKRDKFLTGSVFNKALDVTDYETVATAAVAGIACAARAGTIETVLPAKDNKVDNDFAASHALASGVMGIVTAVALTAPFKAGSNYVMKEMKQNLSEKTLKRLWPHIDLKSINNPDGTRKPMKEWLDVLGNKFIEDMKGCEKLPKLKNLADVSEKTFEKLLNVKDVDWAAYKGKSFNDVKLRDGKKLYDVIDMSRLGINVKEEGIGETQILLSDLDKDFMQKFIKDAKDAKNHWGDLDINSMYDAQNKVVDFRQWKDAKGQQWKLDLDEVGVSSPYETNKYKPRQSGAKRYDKKENVYKFISYQNNGKNGALGSPVTTVMAETDAANDGLFKLLTWGPDLLFRIPVAATTIALIPWMLKNVFGIEKSSAKQKTAQTKLNSEVNSAIENKKVAQPSFKGKEVPPESKNWIVRMWKKISDKFVESFGKRYGKPLIESEKVHNISRWLSKFPGTVTQHMTAFGSLITSGVYVQQTLTKKDLDPDRRRTLAVNQGLCFVVPTVAAYTVDNAINGWVKKVGYDYSDLYEHKVDIKRLENNSTEALEKIEKEAKNLSKKMKGIRTLASITVFAIIYRYLTPVLITPFANKLGDKWNASRKAKKELAVKPEEQKNDEKTLKLEVANNTKETKKSA